MSVASVEQVLTNLKAVSESITTSKSLIASSVRSGSASAHSIAVNRVLSNLKTVNELLSALSIELASSVEASSARGGASATMVASSVRLANPSIGATASMVVTQPRAFPVAAFAWSMITP